MSSKKARIASQSLLSRLSGFSFFGVGASWKAPEDERKVVRDIITFMEDRRALYNQAVWEQPGYVVQSVIKIREELTTALKRVGDRSPAFDAFRIMRQAAREFLDQRSSKTYQDQKEMMRGADIWQQEEFFVGLGKMRAVFGQQLATLAYLYGVDVEDPLASIFPPTSS